MQSAVLKADNRGGWVMVSSLRLSLWDVPGKISDRSFTEMRQRKKNKEEAKVLLFINKGKVLETGSADSLM